MDVYLSYCQTIKRPNFLLNLWNLCVSIATKYFFTISIYHLQPFKKGLIVAYRMTLSLPHDFWTKFGNSDHSEWMISCVANLI